MPLLSLLCNVTVLSPLFLGALFAPFPEVRLFWETYLSGYIRVLLVYAAWAALLLYVNHVLLKTGRLARFYEALRIAGLLVLAALVLATLELTRSVFLEGPFAVLVASLAASGLSFSLYRKRKFFLAVLSEALSILCVSYLSFLMVLSGFTWEALLPCLGLTGVLAGRRISLLLGTGALKSSKWRSSVGILFAAGPAITCSLSVLGYALEPRYALLCGIFPLVLSLATQARECPLDKPLGLAFGRKANVTAGAYVALLLVLRLWFASEV